LVHRTIRIQKYLDQQRKTGWPFAAEFFDREKLMHTIPLNTGRHPDRAGVAKRAISITLKLLNSQVAQNSKSPFSNPRARTAKLCAHSRLTSAQNYSIGKLHSLLILR
jgi:hypothetical protein